MSRVDERSSCVGFPGKVIGVAHSTHSIRFFGARGHGASAFPHPTLATARRSDGAILLPLAKWAHHSPRFFHSQSRPRTGHREHALPSPPARGSAGCSAALPAPKNVFAVNGR